MYVVVGWVPGPENSNAVDGSAELDPAEARDAKPLVISPGIGYGIALRVLLLVYVACRQGFFRSGRCLKLATLGKDMARKILNRKELRQESDTAERLAAEKGSTTKKTVKKKAKRKSRAKAAAEVRLKASWGVFNQSLRRIALFEYSQREEAEQKAKNLSDSQKTPHFIQLVKEVIEE